jgi:hypothetical protein
LLLGLLFLAAVVLTGVALALDVDGTRIGRSIGIAIVAGLLVGLGLGLNLTNRGWSLLGDSILPLTEAGVRPLATAVVVTPVVLAIVFGVLRLIQSLRDPDGPLGGQPSPGERFAVGLPTAIYAAWMAAFVDSYSARVVWFDGRQALVAIGAFVVVEIVCLVIGRWRVGFALLTGVAIGVSLGFVLGAFSAIATGGRVGAAIGVTVWLIAWVGLIGLEMKAFFEDFDTDKMKERFVPQKTIDMTKETIEWARERMPLSRKS